jgi:hypothetical protein
MVSGVLRRTGVGGGVPAPSPSGSSSPPPIINDDRLEEEQHTIMRPTPANIGIAILDVYYYNHIFYSNVYPIIWYFSVDETSPPLKIPNLADM